MVGRTLYVAIGPCPIGTIVAVAVSGPARCAARLISRIPAARRAISLILAPATGRRIAFGLIGSSGWTCAVRTVVAPIVTPRFVATALMIGIPSGSVVRGVTPAGRLRGTTLVRLVRLVRTAARGRTAVLPIRPARRRGVGTAAAFGPPTRSIVVIGGIGLIRPVAEGTPAGPTVTFTRTAVAGRGRIVAAGTRCVIRAIAVE